MPLQATSGAASYDAFGGGVPAVPNYIEEVFSTYLYTGNGTSQTITNNIDLSTKGGLVWIKDRTVTENHNLFDTVRGAGYQLITNETGAQGTFDAQRLSAFTTSGFSVGSRGAVNLNNSNFVSWTFREQPKFFDIVTYTGNGSTQNIAHNLNATVGCIIVKATSSATGWGVYHRSVGNTAGLVLNGTSRAITDSGFWNNTSPTSTQFTVGSGSAVNTNGVTYVAYLFAHDSGGFGLSGTDNVISCGSYTGNGSTTGPTVTLGYEPQWILIKNSAGGAAGRTWLMIDNMRSMSVTQNKTLFPNTDEPEATKTSMVKPTATGFTIGDNDTDVNESGATYIYMAIRRGPMKVPTDATKFFLPTKYTSPTYGVTTTGFPVDMVISANTATSADGHPVADRLRGSEFIYTNTTGAGAAYTINWARQDSFDQDWWGVANVLYSLRRAPSFFDEVCYTGTGSATTQTHNLGVAPEMIIVKSRSGTTGWVVYVNTLSASNYLVLNNTSESRVASTIWNDTAPTSSVFSVGTNATTNTSAATYVAYLFATCAGVSKVGSYTGTATTKQIDCGFTGGARFVLIKRTDTTGDWYVWDSARGIVSGNDPYLLLNSTAAEVTSTDYIDTYSAGFEISSTAPAAINASGGTFIFLAIA
jgi:hypothetical protein